MRNVLKFIIGYTSENKEISPEQLPKELVKCQICNDTGKDPFTGEDCKCITPPLSRFAPKGWKKRIE